MKKRSSRSRYRFLLKKSKSTRTSRHVPAEVEQIAKPKEAPNSREVMKGWYEFIEQKDASAGAQEERKLQETRLRSYDILFFKLWKTALINLEVIWRCHEAGL